MRVARVVSLPQKDGREPFAPYALDGRQPPDLVTDEYVVVGGIPPLDVHQHSLLEHIHEYASVDRIEQPRALDLAWLEHDIAVGQDDRRAALGQMPDDVERPPDRAVPRTGS